MNINNVILVIVALLMEARFKSNRCDPTTRERIRERESKRERDRGRKREDYCNLYLQHILCILNYIVKSSITSI